MSLAMIFNQGLSILMGRAVLTAVEDAYYEKLKSGIAKSKLFQGQES